jgi:hypothetical protein
MPQPKKSTKPINKEKEKTKDKRDKSSSSVSSVDIDVPQLTPIKNPKNTNSPKPKKKDKQKSDTPKKTDKIPTTPQRPPTDEELLGDIFARTIDLEPTNQESLDYQLDRDKYGSDAEYLKAVIRLMEKKQEWEKEQRLREQERIQRIMLDLSKELRESRAQNSAQNSNTNSTQKPTTDWSKTTKTSETTTNKESVPDRRESDKISDRTREKKSKSSESSKTKSTKLVDRTKLRKFVNDSPYKSSSHGDDDFSSSSSTSSADVSSDSDYSSSASHTSSSSASSTSSSDDSSSSNSSSSSSRRHKRKRNHTTRSTKSLLKSKSIRRACEAIFDIDREISYVLGSRSQRRKFDRKVASPKYEFPNLEIYQDSMDFLDWWKKFKNAVQSCRIVGFQDQIELSFRSHMNKGIQDFFDDLQTEEALSLKDMIICVLSNHTKVRKTSWDYKKKLEAITKKPQETVQSYYLRFCNLAKLAKCKNQEELKEIFLVGLTPEAMMKKVSEKMKDRHTLEDLHQIAVKIERKHNQFLQYQKQQNAKKPTTPTPNNPTNNNNKPNGKQQPQAPKILNLTTRGRIKILITFVIIVELSMISKSARKNTQITDPPKSSYYYP